MAVQARFWVQEVTKRKVNTHDIAREVVLAPVIRQTPDDNVQWAKYTPSGKITLTVTADAAGQWFEDMLGEDVAITFDSV